MSLRWSYEQSSWWEPRSRQSARLFLQSSELANWDSPTPSPAAGSSPPFGSRAGCTLTCGRGGRGGPNSDEETGTVVLLCKLFSKANEYLWDFQAIHSCHTKQLLAALLTKWISLRCAGYPPYKTAASCSSNLMNSTEMCWFSTIQNSCQLLFQPDEQNSR